MEPVLARLCDECKKKLEKSHELEDAPLMASKHRGKCRLCNNYGWFDFYLCRLKGETNGSNSA